LFLNNLSQKIGYPAIYFCAAGGGAGDLVGDFK